MGKRKPNYFGVLGWTSLYIESSVGTTLFVLTLLTVRFLLARTFRYKRCSELRSLNFSYRVQ